MALHDAVPAKEVELAQIPGMANVRTWGDDGASAETRLLKIDAPALKAKFAARARSGQPLRADYLALSGGGDDGAFSAGLLVGWGARGDRPSFDLVTGISAGSLVAPFIFLGRDYDSQLAELFVKHGEEEIYQAKILAGVLGGPAVADNAPLARLIARYVDRAMLARIAQERRNGRYLLIGTTNLNAQRPVFWDMGRIAEGNSDRALILFRKVLLASAALPGIFPPVEIEVLANGRIYSELHVDGGPTRAVFFTPGNFHFRDIDKVIGRKVSRRLWVIRNGKITPEYGPVDLSAIAIAARSLETLTKNQGIGDLIRMYENARTDGIDFSLAAIPADFNQPRPKPFARSYMQALYERGFKLGREGYPWIKKPPGVL